MWLLASLACTNPPAPSGGACAPGPGEILVVETGFVFTYLDRAIGDGRGLRTICLGEGSYETSLDLQETEAELLRGRVSLVGAGSDATLLTSPDGDPWVMRVASDLELQGLGFRMPVEVEGLTLSLTDVAVEDFETEAVPARFEALESVEIRGLRLSGLEVTARALELSAGEDAATMQIEDLQLLGLRSMTGELAALEHPAHVEGLVVTDNVALTNAPGASGITASSLSLVEATLSGNELNGPVLAPTGSFEATGLSVTGNLSRVLGALTLMQDASIREATITDNSGGGGALSLVFVEPDRSLTLESVDLGEDSLDNQPCDVGVNTSCLALELGWVDELECDQAGCR
jgi:hypothetical protein